MFLGGQAEPSMEADQMIRRARRLGIGHALFLSAGEMDQRARWRLENHLFPNHI